MRHCDVNEIDSIESLSKGKITITQDGKPVAVIVPHKEHQDMMLTIELLKLQRDKARRE